VRCPSSTSSRTAIHERIGFVFGSSAEVERVERYHREQAAEPDEADTPLFNTRGLFRTAD